MPSQDKLIKQGIKYTDSLFDEISKRLEKGILSSDTLESFLNKTKEYTTNNPLVSSGYDKKMLDLILQETNNHKFSRPAQKELVRVTIENQVGDLITNVGEDIKEDVRDIVKSGFNEGLSQDEIADNISNRITVIKHTRARTIARTEIARTATVSDYIINKERGANYFVVDCRSTRCEVCKEAYCKSSEIGGDVEYDIDDVGMLPPKHPNCRCVAVFGIDPKRKKTKPQEATEEVSYDNDANNTLLRGGPEVYKDVDDTGKPLTVYKYGNIELAFNENARISHDELAKHIQSLPKVFEETQAKRIIIHDYRDPYVGGVWKPHEREVHVYDSRKSIEGLYNVFNHEFAHSLDVIPEEGFSKLEYSSPKRYQRIFDADNQLGYSNLGVIEPEVPIKFVTSYAGRSYLKYHKYKTSLHDWIYIEDFAEASAYYLNPNLHEQFVKEYPNRAEYMESIYGKPDFKNSGIKKISDLTHEQLKLRDSDSEFKSITKQDVYEFYSGGMQIQRDLINQQRDENQNKIESLKEEKRKTRAIQRGCETEECEDKARLKLTEIRIEIKRAQKVEDELFNKWEKTFDDVKKLKSILN